MAEDFLTGGIGLPNSRYRFESDRTGSALLADWFPGGSPEPLAYRDTAASIRVEGMFNVNSTSVEAWKAVLGSLTDSRPATQTRGGEEELGDAGNGTDTGSLLTPFDEILAGDDTPDVLVPSQWVGRRLLTPEQVDGLAEALVAEIRKRGPFLSLADFVNRRPGNDKELAISGALQSAIDDSTSGVNEPFAGRETDLSAATEAALEFPEAEEGMKSLGIPGIVKQGDLLTPLAPFISVRSDAFLIRAYGESVDAIGIVIARAWCEARVERSAAFVDQSDPAETAYADLTSETNREMGRRFRLTGFRWLNGDEI